MNQNFMFYNLLLMLILFSICCYTDQSLNYFKSKLLEAFQKTPKVWHNYIRMYLHIYLKGYQCENFKLDIFKIFEAFTDIIKSKR